MQNCKNPEWYITKPKPDSYSLRLVGSKIQLIKNDKVLVSEIDLSHLIKPVAYERRSTKKKAE